MAIMTAEQVIGFVEHMLVGLGYTDDLKKIRGVVDVEVQVERPADKPGFTSIVFGVATRRKHYTLRSDIDDAATDSWTATRDAITQAVEPCLDAFKAEMDRGESARHRLLVWLAAIGVALSVGLAATQPWGRLWLKWSLEYYFLVVWAFLLLLLAFAKRQ